MTLILGLAFSIIVLTDSIYNCQELHNVYVTGTLLDVGWPLQRLSSCWHCWRTRLPRALGARGRRRLWRSACNDRHANLNCCWRTLRPHPPLATCPPCSTACWSNSKPSWTTAERPCTGSRTISLSCLSSSIPQPATQNAQIYRLMMQEALPASPSQLREPIIVDDLHTDRHFVQAYLRVREHAPAMAVSFLDACTPARTEAGAGHPHPQP